MELLDVKTLAGRGRSLGDGARMAALLPSGGLVALDWLEVQPGSTTPSMQTPEEHFFYVVSGSGEITGGDSGPVAQLRPGSLIRIAPREAHTITASGREELRALVVSSLLVLSDRALGIESGPASAEEAPMPEQRAEAARERLYVAAPQPARPEPPARREEPVDVPADEEEEAPRPDISGLLRKASELTGQPRPERRKPAPEPEPPVSPDPEPAEEVDEEEDRGLMELSVVFDGGSRGNPGQGYGSYLVQSPGRKPVIKRVEFGPNYTNNQAEYDSLLACLQYIVERLTATNRKPDGVALDIKTDSELVANQLLGTYKVKDAGLRTRHAQAMGLLEQFGEWQIETQDREETVKLLGH